MPKTNNRATYKKRMPPIPNSKSDRHCPALNEFITTQRCGSERGTKISCPSSCPHSPFAISNYDKALVLTQKIVPKILIFIKAEVSQEEMKLLTQDAHLDGKNAPSDPDQFFQHMIHFGLAFFRDSAGQTLADRWRQKGFIGLSNDEQVAVAGYGRSYVSVLEVQDIAPDGKLWVVDLFHPKTDRFLIIDRATASSVSRFTLLMAWFLPLPHYTRISGVTAVHVVRETLETWKDDLARSWKSARSKRRGLTREEYLASTFHLQIQRMTDIGKERQLSMLKGLDFCRAIGRYQMNVPYAEIVSVLASKSELEAVDPKAGDGFDKPLLEFAWVRRGESKALEKEMIAQFQHSDSDDGSVGGLATLRVYSDRMVLETFSRQKYDFARGLLDQWLGTKLSFQAESIEDVAKMMAEKRSLERPTPGPSTTVSPYAVFASGSKTSEARRVPKSSPIPPALARKAMQAFYEDRYRKFADEPVPMLENATPREASRRKALRPRLIELMKIHIQGIEETNQKQGTQISLDWLLDELGIPELRSRG